MIANDLLEAMIRHAVNLTVGLEADDRVVANYIDDIPHFLLRVYQYQSGDDDDELVDKFLEWIVVNAGDG